MTAVDTTSSQPVEPMPDTVDSVLECIARAVDMFELERAWVEGCAASQCWQRATREPRSWRRPADGWAHSATLPTTLSGGTGFVRSSRRSGCGAKHLWVGNSRQWPSSR